MFRSIPFVFCFALGCGPSATTTSDEPVPPVAISLTDLVEAYRFQPDVADSAYTGRRVRVSLSTYRVLPDGIGVEWGKPESPPIVLFRCEPPRKTQPIIVTGVCRGRVKDDRPRAAAVRWYLLVDQCSWVPQ